MRKSSWLVLLVVMVLPAMFFAVSCAKQVTGQETGPAEVKAPAAAPAPAPAPKPSDDAAARLKEDRLKAEEAARAARDKFVNDLIYFEFDSSALMPQAQAVLKEKAAYMQANQNIRVKIEGHCDERGTDAYNMALGERRAEAAKTFLVNAGINASRISTISYGEERPLDPAHNEMAWAKNRRDQFVIE